MATTTVLCGSLSRFPVALGARMHRAGYAALGLDYAYVPFAVSDLSGALAGMRALGIRGFGVSMPYKLEVIPLLDELHPLAARIGAVNTIVNDGGRLVGHNTDCVGALRALEECTTVRGSSVLVIGAGGAARAVAYGLCDAGARVCVVNRTLERAQELVASLNAEYGDVARASGLDALALLDEGSVIVNASSAGMAEYGAASPVPESALRSGQVVMDIVYKPLRTELMLAAERRGARAVHGGRMLLHQAARQFELYTGQPAPLEAMDAALRAGMVEQAPAPR